MERIQVLSGEDRLESVGSNVAQPREATDGSEQIHSMTFLVMPMAGDIFSNGNNNGDDNSKNTTLLQRSQMAANRSVP